MDNTFKVRFNNCNMHTLNDIALNCGKYTILGGCWSARNVNKCKNIKVKNIDKIRNSISILFYGDIHINTLIIRLLHKNCIPIHPPPVPPK